MIMSRKKERRAKQVEAERHPLKLIAFMVQNALTGISNFRSEHCKWEREKKNVFEVPSLLLEVSN